MLKLKQTIALADIAESPNQFDNLIA